MATAFPLLTHNDTRSHKTRHVLTTIPSYIQVVNIYTQILFRPTILRRGLSSRITGSSNILTSMIIGKATQSSLMFLFCNQRNLPLQSSGTLVHKPCQMNFPSKNHPHFHPDLLSAQALQPTPHQQAAWEVPIQTTRSSWKLQEWRMGFSTVHMQTV